MKLKLDNLQIEILKKLDILASKLENKEKRGIFSFFSAKNKENIKSFYFYSAPGRGKTMLMTKFYNKIKKTPKIYFHFNEFMYQIHQNLHEIRSSDHFFEDELIEATKRVIKDSKLICFDEFQVQDIADAMLLGRIFSYIFSLNIVCVMTSNSKPQDLYKNGLQREKFLEFVTEILIPNSEVIKLDDDIDYRLQYSQNLDKRYFLDSQKDQFHEIIENYIGDKILNPKIIKVWGRDVLIKRTYEKTAVINFRDLTEENLSSADFKEISRYFDLIFLEDLPRFSYEEKNEQRRFMLFIDEIYENKTALIISSKSEIEDLYIDQKDKETNARTISRLNEIKSDYYFKHSKLF